jgi:hypothetical protein
VAGLRSGGGVVGGAGEGTHDAVHKSGTKAGDEDLSAEMKKLAANVNRLEGALPEGIRSLSTRAAGLPLQHSQ